MTFNGTISLDGVVVVAEKELEGGERRKAIGHNTDR